MAVKALLHSKSHKAKALIDKEKSISKAVWVFTRLHSIRQHVTNVFPIQGHPKGNCYSATSTGSDLAVWCSHTQQQYYSICLALYHLQLSSGLNLTVPPNYDITIPRCHRELPYSFSMSFEAQWWVTRALMMQSLLCISLMMTYSCTGVEENTLHSPEEWSKGLLQDWYCE